MRTLAPTLALASLLLSQPAGAAPDGAPATAEISASLSNLLGEGGAPELSLHVLLPAFGDPQAEAARSAALGAQLARTSTRADAQPELARLELRFWDRPEADRAALASAYRARHRAAHQQASARAQAVAAKSVEDRAAVSQAQTRRSAAATGDAQLKELLRQRAKVLAAHQALARAEQARLATRQRAAAESSRALAEIHRLERMSASVKTSSAARTGLSQCARWSRYAAEALRQSLRPPEEVGGAAPQIASVELRPGAEAARVKAATELDAARQALRSYQGELRAEAERARAAAQRRAWDELSALFSARTAFWRALSPEDRAEALGPWAERWAAAKLQAETLGLRLRALPAVRFRQARALWASRWAFSPLRPLIPSALLSLSLLGLLIWAWRRTPAWARGWSQGILRSDRSLRGLWRARWLQRSMEGYRTPLFVLCAWGVARALYRPGAALELELHLGSALVFWGAIYLLASRIVRDLAEAIARRQRWAPGWGGKLHQAAVQLKRWLIGSGLLLNLVLRLVGPGALYSLSWAFVLVTGGLLGLLLARRWRVEIFGAHLRMWPRGRLARWVEARAPRAEEGAGPRAASPELLSRLGLFVAAGAGVSVVFGALLSLLKALLLSSEWVRRGLAFLFRKRLEARAEDRGKDGADVESLSKELRRAFTLEPTERAELRIEHRPGFDALERALSAWKKGRGQGSCLLSAERGYGKSSWLRQSAPLAEAAGLTWSFVPLERAAPRAESLVAQLGAALGLEAPTLEALETALIEGPRRLLVLDDLHRLFLREPGGMAALTALSGLMHHTLGQVFWLVSVDARAWRFIRAVPDPEPSFSLSLKLGPWSEAEIYALLVARVAASGVAHQFQDLVAGDDPEDDALEASSQAYARLIWDHADGSPLVALSCWLRSLTPMTRRRVRVRLFRAPDSALLQAWSQPELFLFAALATSERLSSIEASRALRLPAERCELWFQRAEDLGIVAREADGRFCFQPAWLSTVSRFLELRHML